MKRLLILCLLVIFSCKDSSKEETIADSNISKKEKNETVVNTSEVNLEIYDYDGLKPLINKTDDKVYVVNFWATWCAPCVKELPYFEALNQEYKDQGVEFLLVSLDFPRNYDKKLKPFIKEKKLKSKVVAFDDVNQNRWIPAIDEKWSGALPATIIYSKDKRQFYEKSFTKDELETEIKQFLK
ncbi:redoxin domain-containing protein [Winogradskyella sp.]|uniref:redoxin domain-containing protein n=1 Tax=Winogradskyella sp. TaxID=1883156 RepID=UPI003F6AB5BC